MTLLFEDGTSAEKTRSRCSANSRFNGERLGTAPAQIVGERAMYWDALGQTWAAGTNALATKLQ